MHLNKELRELLEYSSNKTLAEIVQAAYDIGHVDGADSKDDEISELNDTIGTLQDTIEQMAEARKNE